ncbi:right-handed parallel beta-helix repeat-containing protein [Promicromonospora sp. NPDC019610]|uniref:right-handed parallel beta-helix repeat-containing protein n=1 Tax=Promicromonospora sp. NPDC019610 TaxID=3364405 RepID=UPI0037A6A2D3
MLAATLAPLQSAQASPQDRDRTYYAAPDGRDVGRCQATRPCSLEHVQDVVRHEARKGRDITVLLADGTYRVAEPLEFRAQDGGRDGRTVRWTAAPGAEPVISGATEVSGWSVYDEDAGVYVADAPRGLDSRQLYVNGVIAQRASLSLANSDVTPTPAGLTINNRRLDYLGELPDQDRIEFQSLGDFTNRYSPVESIDGSMITMAQPAWDNNTWGWDTVQNSFLAGPTWYLENSLAFLDEVGEWYLDPSAGKVYYKPGAGVDPDDLDVELPRVESLVSIAGTYDEPVTGLELDGIQFTGTSWLGPSSHGYATQQNGAYIKDDYDYRPDDAFTSCSRGCEMFERARFDAWYQEPAAVQISAARDITLSNNRFTNLGQTALGIGNDANATLAGIGLGASGIDVLGNVFNEVGGHGIAVGGVREDAHHPSDPRMINKDIRIENNTVNRVAVEYKDNSGILSTYATNVQIVHNEVANVAYDGIDTGYGWGINDAGGSAEYVRRGYYNWHPRYTTPTTLKDNLVAGNLVHHTKARFADGGSLYNLSASPGTVVERNYLFNVSGVGLYLDEGTRYTTYRQNVLQGTNPWIFTNAYSEGNNTSDNMIRENWFNSGGAQIPNAEQRNNQLIDNVSVSGTNWPQGALEVMCAAGVAPAHRTTLNANLFGLAQCPVEAPVDDRFETTALSADESYFGQRETTFGVAGSGADVWGGGGQRDDAFGALYRAGSVSSGSSVSARVDTLNDTNAWAKSGVMIRNDLAAPGTSAGYAIAAVTPRNGVVFQWDANADGYVDTAAQARIDTHRAVWVRLDRTDGRVAASYSYDGVNYRQIGSAVALPGAAEVQDGGIFSTSHDVSTAAINVFSNPRLGAAQ